MDAESKHKGRVAEAKVLAHLVENGYEVFLPFADCGSVDLLAMKDGIIQRVSVKYTSVRKNQKWNVKLSNVSRLKDGGVNERVFNYNSCDLLAVYIGPEDRVVLKPVDFEAKYAIVVA